MLMAMRREISFFPQTRFLASLEMTNENCVIAQLAV